MVSQEMQKLLLSEQIPDADILFEATQDTYTDKGGRKQKKVSLKSKMMQSRVVNGNGRVYLREAMEKCVGTYQSNIRNGTAVGELDHPQKMGINLHRVVLLIESLNMVGNDAEGTGVIITESNPLGQQLTGLVNAGYRPGLSSRAAGLVKKQLWEGKSRPVVHAMHLNAVDVVHGPSGPDCYAEFLTESQFKQFDPAEFLSESINLNWAVDLGTLHEDRAELFESTIKDLSTPAVQKTSIILLDERISGVATTFDGAITKYL